MQKYVAQFTLALDIKSGNINKKQKEKDTTSKNQYSRYKSNKIWITVFTVSFCAVGELRRVTDFIFCVKLLHLI